MVKTSPYVVAGRLLGLGDADTRMSSGFRAFSVILCTETAIHNLLIYRAGRIHKSEMPSYHQFP